MLYIVQMFGFIKRLGRRVSRKRKRAHPIPHPPPPPPHILDSSGSCIIQVWNPASSLSREFEDIMRGTKNLGCTGRGMVVNMDDFFTGLRNPTLALRSGDSNTVLFTAHDKEGLCGWCVCTVRYDNSVHLDIICSHKKYGGKILRTVEAYFKDKGIERITLTAAEGVEEFYEKMDYLEIYDKIFMKRLNQSRKKKRSISRRVSRRRQKSLGKSKTKKSKIL